MINKVKQAFSLKNFEEKVNHYIFLFDPLPSKPYLSTVYCPTREIKLDNEAILTLSYNSLPFGLAISQINEVKSWLANCGWRRKLV